MNKFVLDIGGLKYEDFDLNFLIKSLENMLTEEVDDNFLILDSEEPIQKSIYLQTFYEDEMFDVETRIEHENKAFSHYLFKTNDIEIVKNIFIDYYKYNKIPNILEWEDITDIF